MSDRDKREVTAAYYAMVELIDENVGRSDRRLGGNRTTGKHHRHFHERPRRDAGRPRHLLEGTAFLYEAAVHVPLIMQWPDQFQPTNAPTG